MSWLWLLAVCAHCHRPMQSGKGYTYHALARCKHEEEWWLRGVLVMIAVLGFIAVGIACVVAFQGRG